MRIFHETPYSLQYLTSCFVLPAYLFSNYMTQYREPCCVTHHFFLFLSAHNSKFNVFDECLKKATEGKCEQGGADFANALLQKYAGELLSTVCSAFKSGERCASISFANTKGDTSLRSVLAPLIKVSDALG